MNYTYINDGNELNKSDIEYWNLNDYIKQNQNKITADFVGFIIKKDEVLLAFPKKYDYTILNDGEKIDILKKIINIIVKDERSRGSYNLNNKDEFPYKAYFDIAMHYKKYGLHFNEYKEEKMGYAGNINWNKTFKKSEKYISNGNVVFIPFVINQKFTLANFIGECMEYVLTDVYLNYKEYLDGVIPYNNKPKNTIFKNYELCYKQLIAIKNMYFKDIEKKLIDALINYFKWQTQHSSSVKMVTTKFETYWEKLVENYLNTNFIGLDANKDLILDINKSNNIKFIKQSDYIEHDEVRKGNKDAYSIEYDHIYINDNDKIIYLFDSKYYNEDVKHFNYKQAYYYYHLRNLYPEYTIHNGLVLPTEKDYYSKVHINRDFISNTKEKNDGLMIMEYYINLKEIIDEYLKK